MSRSGVYLSMALWALLGLLALAVAWHLVALTYPDWHVAARMAGGVLAFNMVYWLRAFARRRGWAMISYAPGQNPRQ
jgi:hypothetical protein